MSAPVRVRGKSPLQLLSLLLSLFLCLFLFLCRGSSPPDRDVAVAFVAAATSVAPAVAARTDARTDTDDEHHHQQRQQQQQLRRSHVNARGEEEEEEEEEDNDQENVEEKEEEELLLSIDDYDEDDDDDDDDDLLLDADADADADDLLFDGDDNDDDNDDVDDGDGDDYSSSIHIRRDRELKPATATATVGTKTKTKTTTNKSQPQPQPQPKKKNKPPCFKKQKVYDVIIVGAGAAGAGAARELYKWNEMAPTPQQQMNYLVLEATNRIGGRIYDVEFGSGHDPANDQDYTEGIWGGFDATGRTYSASANSNTTTGTHYTTPPTNIGCNCQGTPAVPVPSDEDKDEDEDRSSSSPPQSQPQPQPAGCERMTVEAGAWRFRGDRGIKTSCNDLFDEETGAYWEGEMTIHESCTNVHPNINRLYALSQGQGGGSADGGFTDEKELLNVRCDSYLNNKTYSYESNETHYYDIEYETAHYYDHEYGMERVDTTSTFLPLVNNKTTKGRVTDFITELDKSIAECVDQAGVAIYYHWYYSGDDADDYDYSTPAKIGATGRYSKNWTMFDQTYNTVPDVSTVEWGRNAGEKRRTQTKWCKKFRKHVQSYLMEEEENDQNTKNDPETHKMKLRAQQWSAIYNRWNYDSAYLTNDVSFANFWDGPPPWSGEYNTVIDQRGISTLIKKIMPAPHSIGQHKKNKNKMTGRVKYKTTVKHIDYSGTHCGCKGKVMITAIVTKKRRKQRNHQDLDSKQDAGKNTEEYKIVKKKRYFCAKKVLSTVSVGVLQKQKKLFQPSIQQQAKYDSPWREQGSLIKVFLRFPTKFWNDHTLMTTYIMKNEFRVNQTDRSVRGNLFYSIDYLLRSNPSMVEDYVRQYNTTETTISTTLLCFISSPDWELTGLEQKQTRLTQEYIGEKIWKLLDPLRTQYADTYQDPNCFFYYNWGSDPNFYGSYPVWKPGASLFDHEEFYKPLTIGGKEDTTPVVWLSGESSCAYHWGTMSGAYEAGSRDSRVIIQRHIGNKLAKQWNIHTFSACGTQRGDYEDYCLAPPWDDGDGTTS